MTKAKKIRKLSEKLSQQILERKYHKALKTAAKLIELGEK